MISRVFPCLVVLAAATAFGQPQQSEREQPRMSRSLNRGNWVGKHVLTKEFMDKVGIQGDQAAKLESGVRGARRQGQ